jgi:hypothetical protein
MPTGESMLDQCFFSMCRRVRGRFADPPKNGQSKEHDFQDDRDQEQELRQQVQTLEQLLEMRLRSAQPYLQLSQQSQMPQLLEGEATQPSPQDNQLDR